MEPLNSLRDPPALFLIMPNVIRVLSFLVLALSFVTAASQTSADDWHRLSIPDAWRKVPKGELAPIDGYSWYRALVKIPADWELSLIHI